MSLLKVLMMIMVMIPERKNTTTMLFMMEKTCIWVSAISKYTSHLEAHLTSDCCQETFNLTILKNTLEYLFIFNKLKAFNSQVILKCYVSCVEKKNP